MGGQLHALSFGTDPATYYARADDEILVVLMAEHIKAVEQASGLKVPVNFSPPREGDPPSLYANSAKAQAELGWKPKFMTIDPIVGTAWRWHAKQPKGYADRG